MTDDLPPVPFARPSKDEAYFAEGRAAKHPFAIMYQGEFETPWDGTATAVRLHARALASTGIPVLLKSFTSTMIDEHGVARSVHQSGLPASVEKEVGELGKTMARAFFPIIKHAVIRDAEHLKRLIIPQGAIAKGDIEEQVALRAHLFESTIIYSVWERDRIDPGIVKLLSRVAECWVPCNANAEMLIRSGVPAEKVVVIPHPFDPSDPILRLQQRKPDTEWRKFYSIGRWEPRKGYAELIAAFLTAFKPTDRVVLTIKYTGGKWPDYPQPEYARMLASELPEVIANGWTWPMIHKRVRFHEGRFPRQAILELHYKNNIYVSSSHGEAWCLPAFEAMLAGNELVYVPSGGIEDFAIRGIAVVAPDRESVPESYNWESDAQWTAFSVVDLARALQQAKTPQAHDESSPAWQYALSLEAIGQLMKSRVLGVAAKIPEAFRYYSGADKEAALGS